MKGPFFRLSLICLCIFLPSALGPFIMASRLEGPLETRHLFVYLLVFPLPGLSLALYLSRRFSDDILKAIYSIKRNVYRFPGIKDFGPASKKSEDEYNLNALSLSLEKFLRHTGDELGFLRLEKRLLRSLLNAFHDGVFCLDRQGRIIFQNPAMPDSLMTPGAVGRPYFKTIKNARILEYAHMIVKKGADQAGANFEELYRQVEIDYAGRFYRLNCYPVYMEGETETYLFITRDETVQQNVKRMRQEFLQNASHELKTPITSIRGYTETLLPRAEREPFPNFLGAILRNVLRMERIIEDMVVISQVEAREYPFTPRLINPEVYMENIISLISGALKDKDQELIVHVPRDMNFNADPLLLEHLLLNLIANASRYSPEHSKVRVNFKKTAGDGSLIEVGDEGPGVPAEYREKIFERFFRVDHNRSREKGGTGLGLSIVRHIAALHGGKVWVEAADGGGSVFKVSIPASAPGEISEP